MSIPVKDSPLIDACPPSIADDINVQAVCTALDRQFRELIEDINQTIILPAIDQITDHDLLDLLGWQFHVDYWDANQIVQVKQQLIKSSLDWHTRKGTVDLIQEVCDLAFGPGNATIQEWFEYKNPFPPNYPIDDPDGVGTWHDRYRFRLLFAEDFITDPEVEARVREVIRNYKPVTRWDEGFVRQRDSSLQIYWAAVALGWKQITIEAPEMREAEYWARDVILSPLVLGEDNLQTGLSTLETVTDNKAGPGDVIGSLSIRSASGIRAQNDANLTIGNNTALRRFMFRRNSGTGELLFQWTINVVNAGNFQWNGWTEAGDALGPIFVVAQGSGIVNFTHPFTVGGQPWPPLDNVIILENEIRSLTAGIAELKRRIELLERD